MAGIKGIATNSGAGETLAAATAETVLQLIAGTNHPFKLLGFGFSFNGISVTEEPVLCELRLSSTDGTSSGVPANNLEHLEQHVGGSTDGQAFQTSANETFSAEPTMTGYLKRLYIHPQGGYEYSYPMGQEPVIDAGGRVNMVFTAPATVEVLAHMIFEE